jgi:hypothetical protein
LTVAEDREAAGADVALGWRPAHAAMAARAAAWLKAAMIAEMFREALFFCRVFLTRTGNTSLADATKRA